MLRQKLPVVALVVAMATFIIVFVRHRSGNIAGGYTDANS